jgi:hypothetical protein
MKGHPGEKTQRCRGRAAREPRDSACEEADQAHPIFDCGASQGRGSSKSTFIAATPISASVDFWQRILKRGPEMLARPRKTKIG